MARQAYRAWPRRGEGDYHPPHHAGIRIQLAGRRCRPGHRCHRRGAAGLAHAPPRTGAAPHRRAGRPRIGLGAVGRRRAWRARMWACCVCWRTCTFPSMPSPAPAWARWWAACTPAACRPARSRAVLDSVDWADAFSDRPARGGLNFRRRREDRDFLVAPAAGLPRRAFPAAQRADPGPEAHAAAAPEHPAGGRHHRLRPACPRHSARWPPDLEDRRHGGDAADGDLTTALHASLSAPGLFAPVERNGRLLVDGGVANNLPVDVARAMGVDRLIVVDVGFPLGQRDRPGFGHQRGQPDADHPDPPPGGPAGQACSAARSAGQPVTCRAPLRIHSPTSARTWARAGARPKERRDSSAGVARWRRRVRALRGGAPARALRPEHPRGGGAAGFAGVRGIHRHPVRQVWPASPRSEELGRRHRPRLRPRPPGTARLPAAAGGRPQRRRRRISPSSCARTPGDPTTCAWACGCRMTSRATPPSMPPRAWCSPTSTAMAPNGPGTGRSAPIRGWARSCTCRSRCSVAGSSSRPRCGRSARCRSSRTTSASASCACARCAMAARWVANWATAASCASAGSVSWAALPGTLRWRRCRAPGVPAQRAVARYSLDTLDSAAFPRRGQFRHAGVAPAGRRTARIERVSDAVNIDYRQAHSWGKNTVIAWLSRRRAAGFRIRR